MLITTKVKKIGDIQSYINLPVVGRSLTYDLDSKYEQKAIGVIQDVKELKDHYELSILIWDWFVDQKLEYINDEPSAISISFI